jgi:phospholipase C
MADIKHLVVLMLENRSFDHMLGWLQSPAYQIDGLDGTQFNLDSTGAKVFATRDAEYSGDYDPDVAHDFPDVTQQIFGTASPAVGQAPTMSGFVTDYGQVSGSVADSHHVMKCFDPAKLPVITTLAQQFAVCNRWFASVPGPTLPNRAYAHAATSVGHVDMTINWWKESKTIYELLVANDRTAKIYYSDSTIALTFGGLMDNQDEYFVPDFSAFFDDCKNNNLPDYCFLEPRYNASDGDDPEAASDQHPDHDVSEGEQLIRDVFNAIRSNQQTWESTLLVIVYDEHGGLFDHVAPPAAAPPDKLQSQEPFFAFDRLGVRVPAVLVSPFIPAGTVINTVFDHTSFIATARKLFLGAGWQSQFLTARDQAANTFEGALTLPAPRAAGEVNFSAKHQAVLASHTVSLAARAADQASRPLTQHQQSLMQVMLSAAAAPRNVSAMTQSQASAMQAQIRKVVHPAPAVRKAGQ